MSFVKVKGTYDVLPEESFKWQALEAHVKALYQRFGYQEIRTPIMEYASVFHRDSEQSDMVTKETYNFKDKSNRLLTLRPEGTAGIIRSYVENKLYTKQEVTKLYYLGPNFRYERPQKMRYRQFMQLGVEAIGDSSPTLDAEVVTLAYETIRSLDLKNVKVCINSLGDEQSRTQYLSALKNYLTPFKEHLSIDSQHRFDKNPLRILDSKAPEDQVLLKNAPIPLDYLTPDAQAHFQAVLSLLDASDVIYELSPRLVRGLDYYAHTVFEIQADVEGFGSHNALGGGGRYQHLVHELGGPQLGGIGFAFGMERLLHALVVSNPDFLTPKAMDAFMISFDDMTQEKAFSLMQNLRRQGFSVDMTFPLKSFKAQLKQALKHAARALIILGEEELSQGQVTIKNTQTEKQVKVPFEKLSSTLKEILNHV